MELSGYHVDEKIDTPPSRAVIFTYGKDEYAGLLMDLTCTLEFFYLYSIWTQQFVKTLAHAVHDQASKC